MPDLLTRSAAEFSPCRTWRYVLGRYWDTGPALTFVMLNPSTADEERNDPTVERCERRARRLGYAGVQVLNLFAYRATDPRDMRAATDPVGPDNDDYLAGVLITSEGPVVAAWGTHGMFLNRAAEVCGLTNREMVCLGTTKDGHPRHPLYVPSDAPLVPYA